MFADRQYLLNDQYRDSSKLDARGELHHHFSTNPQGWFPWIWDTLQELPVQARVLELGCGTGWLWSICPDRIPAGWNITLSDLSNGMLDAARRNLVVLGRAFKFERIDGQFIPYADEIFDILIANHMLYHVPDRPKALAEIRRVLKTGGHLVATTVGGDHLKEMNGWLNRLDAEMDFSANHSFILENGAAQLQPFFKQVKLRRYEDNLRITEIPPLMAYLRSTIRGGHMPEAELKKVEQELASELKSKSEMFITKDSGLFEAQK
jgi:SAM-dependent methyltransferase